MLARRIILVLFVLAALALLLLNGCGVTADQRMADTFSALHTPEMDRAFNEARNAAH